MAALVQKLNQKGVTLIELIVVIAIIGIAVLAIVAPQIGQFRSNYNVRACATDLIQNMRVARAMAIKENRLYLITFDTANNRYLIGHTSACVTTDCDLLDLNLDTFGICKDTDTPPDRYPNNDVLVNNVPSCVKVVNLSDCGNNIRFGYGTGDTKPPNGPVGTTVPANGITFTGTPPRAEFNPDGSTDILGSAYFQHTGRGYSYAVRISNLSGATNMWKWDGDNENTINKAKTTWTEIR